MSTYYGILTAIGEAKQAQALGIENSIDIAYLAVGDGGGTDTVPDREQTALVNEVRRSHISRSFPTPGHPNQITVEQVIPANEGGFWVREIGVYDTEGDLIAVANCPASNKPLPSEGAGRTMIVRIAFAVQSPAVFQGVVIDPTAALVTVEGMNEAIELAIGALPATWPNAERLGGQVPGYYAKYTDVLGLRSWAIAAPATADSTVDLDTLGATDATAGKYPYLIGGAAGSRNNGHPAGQGALISGLSDYYWVETFRYSDGTTRFQKAYPAQMSGADMLVRELFRIKTSAGWTTWQSTGKAVADIAQANAQTFATAADTALKAELNAKYDQPKITKALKTSINGFLCLVDGQLWGATGNATTFTRGMAVATNFYDFTGVNNLRRVNIPTQYKIVDFGGAGQSYWALDAQGSLYTWGSNGFGQLGLGHRVDTWTPTLSAQGVVKVFSHSTQGDSSSTGAACRLVILQSDGFIYGCGANGFGSLGVGDTSDRLSWTKLGTFAANSIKNVWNLGSDVGCTVVQTTANELFFAGYDGFGHSGLGSVSDARASFVNITTPWGGAANIAKLVDIVGGFGFVDSSYSRACVMVMHFTDSVRTCGQNNAGQCGDGTTTVRYTPYTIPGIVPAQVVFTGGGAGTCYVRTTSNALYVWGYNGQHQCMNGGTTNVLAPYAVPGVTAQAIISDSHRWNYGYISNVFIHITRGDGTHGVITSGLNLYGECGDNSTAARPSPVQVSLPYTDVDGSLLVPVSVSSMNTGASAQGVNTYVLTTQAGFLWVWGFQGNGGIAPGLPTGGIVSPQPVPLPWRTR